MCPKYCLLAFCLLQIFFFTKAYVAEDYADGDSLFRSSDALEIEVETKNAISILDITLWRVLLKIKNLLHKPCSANVSLALKAEYQADYPEYRKTVRVDDGEAEVSFNRSELDMFFGRDKFQDKLVAERKVGVEIKAIAEQKYVPAIATTTITIFNHRFKFNCLNYNKCHFYKRDKEQDVLYQITHVDGSYVNHAGGLITLNYFTRPECPRTIEYTAPMNETGFVNFKIMMFQWSEYACPIFENFIQLSYSEEYSEIEQVFIH